MGCSAECVAFTSQWSVRDYMHMRRREPQRWQALIVVGLVLWGVSDLLAKHAPLTLPKPLAFVLLAAIVGEFLWRHQRWRREGSQLAACPMLCQANDSGVRCTQNGASQEYAWQSLSGFKEGDRFFKLILIGKGAAPILLAKSQMDPLTVATLRRLLTTHFIPQLQLNEH